MRIPLSALLLWLCVSLAAQSDSAPPAAAAPSPAAGLKSKSPARSAAAPLTRAQTHPPDAAPPVVTFTFQFLNGDPEVFAVSVDSAGKARYLSRGPGEPQPGRIPHEDLYVVDFTMSPATRERIFSAAESLKHFRTDLEFGGKVANMGAKTFIWTSPQGEWQSTFNYTSNPVAHQLAELFFNISHSFEARRRLEYRARFDRLGVDAELRILEVQHKDKKLAEMEVLAPILRRVANDAAFMRIARQRAARLLLASTGASTAPGASTQ